MNIGYACLTVGVPYTDFKTCTMKNASEDNLRNIITENLFSLEKIIDYNIENKIKLFRISSDIIPFGSSPVNTLEWWEEFKNQLTEIGDRIKNAGMRVSMHPGQYTVLNSTDQDVVERAVDDLDYHCLFLDSLGVDSKNKIILHVGGAYGDKESASERFIENFYSLSENIKSRLVLENDERSFNICDVLKIAGKINIPVIFDNLHNEVNPCMEEASDLFWIKKSRETWKEKDGVQKIHYSQQDPDRKKGAHSKTTSLPEFLEYIGDIPFDEIDIMLEVKDKNLSTIKCLNAVAEKRHIKRLEIEWGKYKYNILEKAPDIYSQIRNLLKDKEKYPLIEFYNLIEMAMGNIADKGNEINAALHVWGYFSEYTEEKAAWAKKMDSFENGRVSIKSLKKHLWMLTEKYNQDYLKKSYYFWL